MPLSYRLTLPDDHILSIEPVTNWVKIKNIQGWGYFSISPYMECLPSIYEALGSILTLLK
jgi:hypothetical protein